MGCRRAGTLGMKLLSASEESDRFLVGVVDGPFDPALITWLRAPPKTLGDISCALRPGSNCDHGTFIIGLLGAKCDAPIPGLCPESRLIHVPIFADGGDIVTDTPLLANAISQAVESGARLINLSLSMLGTELGDDKDLVDALDFALNRGALVVTAAGNQGRLATGTLLNHCVTVPVVATDADGGVLELSNLSPSIGARGVGAPGFNISGYSPGNSFTVMTGTSVAAAVVSGTIAQLWSQNPELSASDLRTAIQMLGPRGGLVPPALDLRALRARLGLPPSAPTADHKNSQLSMGVNAAPAGMRCNREGIKMAEMDSSTSPDNVVQKLLEMEASPPPRLGVVVAAQGENGSPGGCIPGGCSCGGAGNRSANPTFVYAIGTVEVLFPDDSLEEELQYIAQEHKIQGQPTSHQWLHDTLSLPQSRFIARSLNWLLTIEKQQPYALKLREVSDLPYLIECLKRSHQQLDLDLVIGVTDLSWPKINCRGTNLPALVVDQIMPFTANELVSRFPKPKGVKTAETPKAFENTAHDVFNRIRQMADNVGATDEHRALNYLSIRYEPLYTLVWEMENRGFVFQKFPVIRSRLAGTRKIIDVIFEFQNRNNTFFIEKFFVRVDATSPWPMIATHLQPYLDRS